MAQKSVNPLIVDTREADEFARSHADGAINISSMEFMKGLPEQLAGLPKDTPMILYCRSGQRSNTCIQILKQQGFTNVTNGINEHHVNKMII